MKIAYLTAGAAGMFCGSCMNDNDVARALIRLGHDCLLVPVYTPIRTDAEDVSVDRVFLGGINVYLQQQVGWFARVPRVVDALLNQPWLISWLTKDAGKTSPALLGALTASMLQGFKGRQRKEFARLLDWLKSDIRPDALLLTNLLIGGAIPELKRSLDAKVFVTLQGDDIFLDSLSERDRVRCESLMRSLVNDVDGFVVHSEAYGAAMAKRLSIPDAKLHVVPLAIETRPLLRSSIPATDLGPDTEMVVGYFARMAPEKGLHRLIDAMPETLASRPTHPVRLRMAGWMGPQHQDYWQEQLRKLEALQRQYSGRFRWDYAGSVDLAGKKAFLESLDLFCVPTVYEEPKGRFLLEAVAMGIPYVMPEHGAFPEMHRRLHQASRVPLGQLFDSQQQSSLSTALQTALKTPLPVGQPPATVLEEIDMTLHAQRLLDVLR